MKVVVAASGTGGHLFPARFIIEALQAKGVDVEFIGSGRPLERKIIEPTGVPHHILTITGIKNLGIRGLIRFLFYLPGAFLSTWRLFSKVKPDVVIGVGGYVTFLPVTVAFLRRVPRWIHEAEHSPGLANAVLSFYSNRVSLAYPSTKLPGFAKPVPTGHPVRPELLEMAKTGKLREKPENLLILGGSQGARALDEVMQGLAPFIFEKKLSIWHQCREENIDAVDNAYRDAGVTAKVVPFIDELPEAFEWADLILSRAGAGAVSEIAVAGKPVVFVPFPYAQNDHQAANAAVLADRGRALLVREGERFTERLQEALETVLSSEYREEFAAKLDADPPQNAALAIAEGALALAGGT